MRIEKDFIGELQIDSDAFYGIHSLRAMENFPCEGRFHIEWYKAVGAVKHSCYKTYKNFKQSIQENFELKDIQFELIDDQKLDALIAASFEVADGKHFDHFIVPSISGGAGTSINMNVNEIITNRALQILGLPLGSYTEIDPIEDANIFQSTNDVVPTALKVAAIRLLNSLEESINKLRFDIEKLESKYQSNLRVGYTQMQEAVPTSFGKLFSTYVGALSRDWWRVSKCFERIKVVNLGGSAIGTGITVPKFFIYEVVNELRDFVGLPITKSENLMDTTANLDSYVEVHATLKSHAVNLEKMVSDIRLLSSDLFKNKELIIPKKQVGSSIMPSKVNPVIPEYAISVAAQVYANDQIVSSMSARGTLELNAYLPIIGNAFLDSIKLLDKLNITLLENLITGMTLSQNQAQQDIFLKSPSLTTALIPYIGYNRASEMAKEMRESNKSIVEVNTNNKYLESSVLDEVLSPSNLLKLGFKYSEIISKK